MPIGTDPIVTYAFSVEVDGMTIAQFQEASGISIEISVIEHKENKLGGLPVMKKLPGHVKYADIVLKRGKVSDKDFWEWIKKVQNGDIDGARKNGSIVIRDYTHGEQQRFNFENGWPSKVEVSGGNAKSDEVMIESVTITHEALKIG